MCRELIVEPFPQAGIKDGRSNFSKRVYALKFMFPGRLAIGNSYTHLSTAGMVLFNRSTSISIQLTVRVEHNHRQTTLLPAALAHVSIFLSMVPARWGAGAKRQCTGAGEKSCQWMLNFLKALGLLWWPFRTIIHVHCTERG